MQLSPVLIPLFGITCGMIAIIGGVFIKPWLKIKERQMELEADKVAEKAAQYAAHLLAPFPAARQRREHPSFGELLDWLDGHPLAMRLTLPRLDTDDSTALLAALQGTVPLPVDEVGEGRLSSLGACVSYSIAHLSEQTRQLLPAVGLFHGVADLFGVGFEVCAK